jgi:hypothetical protein
LAGISTPALARPEAIARRKLSLSWTRSTTRKTRVFTSASTSWRLSWRPSRSNTASGMLSTVTLAAKPKMVS